MAQRKNKSEPDEPAPNRYNDGFTPYKLKDSCIEYLKLYIQPDKLDIIIANLEYYGSKSLEIFSEEQDVHPNSYAFFDNEFAKDWASLPENEELLEFPDYFSQGPDSVKTHPVLCKAISGDDSKVSVIISPECFEVDQLFDNRASIQ